MRNSRTLELFDNRSEQLQSLLQLVQTLTQEISQDTTSFLPSHQTPSISILHVPPTSSSSSPSSSSSSSVPVAVPLSTPAPVPTPAPIPVHSSELQRVPYSRSGHGSRKRHRWKPTKSCFYFVVKRGKISKQSKISQRAWFPNPMGGVCCSSSMSELIMRMLWNKANPIVKYIWQSEGLKKKEKGERGGDLGQIKQSIQEKKTWPKTSLPVKNLREAGTKTRGSWSSVMILNLRSDVLKVRWVNFGDQTKRKKKKEKI